jgi:hypothetical protein
MKHNLKISLIPKQNFQTEDGSTSQCAFIYDDPNKTIEKYDA